MGGTPVNSSAGNAMKLPPPATEFSAPPSTPAAKRKRIVSRVKQLGVTETTSCRQFTNLFHSRTSERRGTIMSRIRGILLLLVLAVSLALAQQSSQTPPPNPCAAPEQKEPDFWVGDSDLTWPSA